MKFFIMWLCACGIPDDSQCVLNGFPRCGKPFSPTGSESYTGTEAHSLLHEEAGNCLTEELTGQDATHPKQEAATDCKEQVDRHLPPTPTPPSTRKLKSRRTNKTTTDTTTRNPISEQRSQEIAR